MTFDAGQPERRQSSQRLEQRRHPPGPSLHHAEIAEPGFALPGRPALYRTTPRDPLRQRPQGWPSSATTTAWSRPTVHARLTSLATVYQPGATRLRPGREPRRRLRPLRRANSRSKSSRAQAWVPAPESPRALDPMPLYCRRGTADEQAADCTVCSDPGRRMAAGRYSGLTGSRRHLARCSRKSGGRRVYAEFEVASASLTLRQDLVRRQVVVPDAERLEGAPEALLGALLVEASRRCRARRGRRSSG